MDFLKLCSFNTYRDVMLCLDKAQEGLNLHLLNLTIYKRMICKLNVFNETKCICLYNSTIVVDNPTYFDKGTVLL